MKKLIVLVLACLFTKPGALHAQSPVERAEITFEIKNLGIATTGTIGGLVGKIHFVPTDPNASTIEASVNVNTISTDNSGRDEHLRSEDFFNVSRYPKITLKSVDIRHKKGVNYIGTFSLTIKDKTRQLEIPFSFIDKGTSEEFKCSFKINRLDFDVGESSMILSNEVIIHIDCEEKKPDVAAL